VFNSLTSISSLCYTDPDAAAQAVADLSGYLRGNINALSSDEPIPFDTELSHIRQYVSLEQADPARAFSMEYDLVAEAFLIPPLTVQPLVENAVKHGALTHRDGSGKVRLSTEDRGQFVRVVVEDNGVRQTNEKASAHEGVGLSSVQKRLEGFGGSMQVDIGDGGSRACVLIPRKER
jgi:LytS/YehU family sensor histidine kinase